MSVLPASALRRQLFLLLHQDIVLLFPDTPSPHRTAPAQMDAMPPADVFKEHGAADRRIKGLLAVVMLAFGLSGSGNPQFLQRLFLLGT